MRLFSQTTRDVERISQLKIHLINISKGVFEASIWAIAHMSMSTSNMDYAALRQGCVPPVCEVHVHNCLLSVQMHEDKVEVYTSVQVHMQEVAELEQFPIGILTCI